MINVLFRPALAAIAAGFAIAAEPALAASITFHADLLAGNEVPPVTIPSSGIGFLDATYDTTTKVLTYSATYSGLTGVPTAARFHGPAELPPPGTTAGVVISLTGAILSPKKGTVTLTDAQATDLQAQKWYFNITTPGNPNGEVRGQLMKK